MVLGGKWEHNFRSRDAKNGDSFGWAVCRRLIDFEPIMIFDSKIGQTMPEFTVSSRLNR
jgi:hypothetical protein